jgi:hypothetical protein
MRAQSGAYQAGTGCGEQITHPLGLDLQEAELAHLSRFRWSNGGTGGHRCQTGLGSRLPIRHMHCSCCWCSTAGGKWYPAGHSNQKVEAFTGV